MKTYTGLIFNKLAHPQADALTLVEDTVINCCIFDFRNIPLSEQDEIVSGVDGPKVTIRNSLFLGGIKAMLAGNGDHLINDSATARWDLENCIIIGSGRRCPEAQDGTIVTMRKCWIHNWGHTFDVRAFGAWAHRGGKILAFEDYATLINAYPGLVVNNTNWQENDFIFVDNDENYNPDNPIRTSYIVVLRGTDRLLEFRKTENMEAVSQATNDSFGVVKGTERRGGIYVETNGEMSLNGWDELEAHTQMIYLTEEDFAAAEDPEDSGLYPSFIGRMVVIQS